MRRILKDEYRKVFHSWLFWTVVGIGCCISSINIVENVLWVMKATPTADLLHRGYAGISLFVRWISVNLASTGTIWFFFIFPILPATAYGWSFLSERKSGYIASVLTRVSKRKYYLSKYIVTYTAGGLVVAIPLLLNLLGNALICPVEQPSVLNMLVPINQDSFLGQIYYSNPWLFSFCAIITDFFWGGATASIAFCVSFFTQRTLTVITVPFALFLAIDMGVYLLGIGGTDMTMERSPFKLLCAVDMWPNPIWVVYGWIAGFTAVSGLIAIVMGARDEVL